ncbi:MAG: hypothetical protein J6A17_02130 [Bacilli bacterium]|nr:hypothetical protein [Bacilli bacterium]
MQFYLDGKVKEYDDDKLEYLDEGFECFVYRLEDDKVLKELKQRSAKRTWLTKESIDRMKSIKTKRILLPTMALTDKKDNLSAYEMDYIEDYGVQNYFDLDKEKLKEENSKLKEDIELISDNKLLVEDLLTENTSFHNGIYFIDPGSYIFDDTISENQAFGMNIDLVNHYLLYEVICRYHLVKYNKSNNFRKSYAFSKDIQLEYNKSGKQDVIEFLSDIEEDNLREFVERRAKH